MSNKEICQHASLSMVVITLSRPSPRHPSCLSPSTHPPQRYMKYTSNTIKFVFFACSSFCSPANTVTAGITLASPGNLYPVEPILAAILYPSSTALHQVYFIFYFNLFLNLTVSVFALTLSPPSLQHVATPYWLLLPLPPSHPPPRYTKFTPSEIILTNIFTSSSFAFSAIGPSHLVSLTFF